MCEAIVSIISMLLPHIRRPPASLVESLQRCLAKFTATHESTAVVQASVKYVLHPSPAYSYTPDP